MKVPKQFIHWSRPHSFLHPSRRCRIGLRTSRQFLDSLIENLPDMVFVKDAESLKFIRFNKASEEILGISQQEMMGKNDYDFFPPDEAKHFIDDDRRVLAGEGVVDIPEEVIQTRHRGPRILHTRKIPVFDFEGKPEFLLGISEDITELKKAQEASLRLAREEAALKEQAAIARRLAFLSEASKALGSSLDYRVSMEKLASVMVPGVLDWCTMNIRKDGDVFERVVVLHRDPEKLELTEKLRLVNRSVAFSTGEKESKREKGKEAAESGAGPMGAVIASGRSIFYPDVSDELLRGTCETEEQFQILKQLGVRSQIVAPIRVREKILGAMVCCMSGSNRRFEATDLPFFEEIGARTGLAIENALLYEAAQDAVVARDEFLSVASHELKTPITSLNLLLEMSQKLALSTSPSDSERLLQNLNLCQAQSKRLSAFVEDLLDVSRMKSGKLRMRLEKCDLGKLVEGMIDQFSDFMKSSGCPVVVSVEEEVVVYCDRFRIEQVILNLLSNATKYGERKTIEIFVEMVGKMALFKVVDHGIGIPAAMIDKIFERFERTALTQKISGLGLGLYISKQIVLAHHGRICVESKEGEGSTFGVELPLFDEDEVQKNNHSSPDFDIPIPR